MNAKLKETIEKIPSKSGVYLFYNRVKELLYIGKSVNLKSRVKSYFSGDIEKQRGPAISHLITQIHSVKYIETPTQLEAIFLESKLIKKNLPLYNSKDKSNKSFIYLLITDEALPRIFKIRSHQLQTSNKIKYIAIFGPFLSEKTLNDILKIIRNVFPYFDYSARGLKSKMYEQIGISPKSDITKKQYQRNIKNIILFFNSSGDKILKTLKQDLAKSIKQEKFEDSSSISNQINKIQNINYLSLINQDFEQGLILNSENQNFLRIEAFDISHFFGQNCIGAMRVFLDNQDLKNETKFFTIKSANKKDDLGSLQEILERRFRNNWTLPDLIVIDGGKTHLKTAENTLKKMAIKIPICACQKNQAHKVEKILGPAKFSSNYSQIIIRANSAVHTAAINFNRYKNNKSFKKINN